MQPVYFVKNIHVFVQFPMQDISLLLFDSEPEEGIQNVKLSDPKIVKKAGTQCQSSKTQFSISDEKNKIVKVNNTIKEERIEKSKHENALLIPDSDDDTLSKSRDSHVITICLAKVDRLHHQEETLEMEPFGLTKLRSLPCQILERSTRWTRSSRKRIRDS